MPTPDLHEGDYVVLILDDAEQRRWADFAAVMDRYTRSPK